MRFALILMLYLGDQLLSEILPYSSGAFAIALIAICMNRTVLYRSTMIGVLVFSIATYFAGVAGASLSGTSISFFFVMTLTLLAGMYIVGAGLQGGDSVLITPRYAFIGVLVSCGFLLLSVLGWDAMSTMQGTPTNRGSGLYIEPSHYALFVMPLWLMAFEQCQYRPWLYVALAFTVVKCFSATLAAFLICAIVVRVYFRATRANFTLYKLFGRLIMGAVLVVIVYIMSHFIPVGGEPMQSYVGSRLYSLMNPEDAGAYNLSSLVTLQGVELADLSFSESLGMGVGLGNFGTSASVVDQSTYRTVIHSITDGSDLNLREGGLLASKLVGELGMLALAIPLLLVRYFRRLKSEPDNRLLDYHGAIAVVLIILIFARGLSYFSAPACLAVFSLAGVLNRRTRLATRARGGICRLNRHSSLFATSILSKSVRPPQSIDKEPLSMIKRYGYFGLVRLTKNWLLTRLLFPNARLVRFPIYIRGKSLMKLGDGLTTGVNVRLDATALYGSPPVLRIGSNVQINDAVHIGAIEQVVIGDHVLIASRVFISDHNHGRYDEQDAGSAPEIPPADRPLSSRPVIIGNNVWLGEQVCIMPGVTVGYGAVVGANSVVTCDIPPNSIAAGNPARVIRVFDTSTQTWRRT